MTAGERYVGSDPPHHRVLECGGIGATTEQSQPQRFGTVIAPDLDIGIRQPSGREFGRRHTRTREGHSKEFLNLSCV